MAGFMPCGCSGASGVWEIFVPGVGVGAHYKFEIRDAHGHIKLNTDPFGFFFEVPPKNAAIVWDNAQISVDRWSLAQAPAGAGCAALAPQHL